MDALLSILKFSGISLTGAFAILGLLVEYKDKATGKINRWGKVALTGILASTALALSTQGVEQWRERQAQRDAAQRTLSELQRHSLVLSEISKSMQPLKDIKLSYWVKVNVDDPEFLTYKARVQHGVNEFLSRYPTWQSAWDAWPREMHLRPSGGDSDGNIQSLSLDQNSKYYPNQTSEGFAYAVLNLHPHVCLRKSPLSSPLPCSFWEGDEGGDLRFLASSQGPNSGTEIEIDVSTSTLTVGGRNLLQDAEFTRKNGKLLAVHDLLGSQIVVFLLPRERDTNETHTWAFRCSTVL